jgi:predicted MPP superfamily phosphohydrolase
MSGGLVPCGTALIASLFSVSFPLLERFPDWLMLPAVAGHVGWLLWLGNIIYSTNWPYKVLKIVGLSLLSCIGGGAVLGVLWWLLRMLGHAEPLPRPLQIYAAFCALNSLVFVLPWLVMRILWRDHAVLLRDRAVRHELRSAFNGEPIGANIGPLLTSLPLNQSLSVDVHEKELRVPRLPAELDGLRVAHLSDWHLYGRIGKPFFVRVAELVSEARPDIVLFTGDIVESAVGLEWLPDVFGRIRAEFGTYFIFGNHDIRIDADESRRHLAALGLVDVGGRWHTVGVRGVDVHLAGNERPWIRQAADPADCPPRGSRPSLKVLLSHSPDQYPWAKRHDFDLMLAGHVHGGQIRIPPVGPILAPSRFGVRYASGTFYESPTVLHVSRGLSSKLPLRMFCPPEITTLVLRK